MPEEDIVKNMGTTKEEWSKLSRILRDDEPQDGDFKWEYPPSKEDVFKLKRQILCANAFGCDFDVKMHKYWNDFRDGCKGRNVPEMGCVMEENFVMRGVLTSSAT